MCEHVYVCVCEYVCMCEHIVWSGGNVCECASVYEFLSTCMSCECTRVNVL